MIYDNYHTITTKTNAVSKFSKIKKLLSTESKKFQIIGVNTLYSNLDVTIKLSALYLVSIELCNCRIIDAGVFTTCAQLRWLNLSYNCLFSLPDFSSSKRYLNLIYFVSKCIILTLSIHITIYFKIKKFAIYGY